MDLRTLETRVLDIVERAVKGHPIEDTAVELKASWPGSPQRAARRIAGHANAASASSILWIIGVDEKRRSVTGATESDLASWWPQVSSHFDGVVPTLLASLSVPIGNQTVVGLLIDSARAPYVVVTSGTLIPDCEVPWREGTAVRTARRADLLRLLVPVQVQPGLEVLSARAWATKGPRGTSWQVVVEAYVDLRDGSVRLVLPYHRIAVSLTLPQCADPVSLEKLTPDVMTDSSAGASGDEFILNSSGRIGFRMWGESPANSIGVFDELPVRIAMRSLPDSRPTIAEVVLVPAPENADPSRGGDAWRFSHPRYPRR
jgi:hypothetical protein